MSDSDDSNNVIRLPLVSGASTTRLIGMLMRQLNYQEMIALARDLHSDSEALGKSPADVAELLARWAERVVAGAKAGSG